MTTSKCKLRLAYLVDERSSVRETEPPPSRIASLKQNLDRALTSALGGSELRLRVLEREHVTRDSLRLRMSLNGLTVRDELYPTYWLRLWFTTTSGRRHQRAYTLVAPNLETDTAWIEFFLHDGTASQWARTDQPGDEIDATVLNSRDPVTPLPNHLLLVGDGSSYPAIADTVRRHPEITTTVLLNRATQSELEWTYFPQRENLTVERFSDDGAITTAAYTAAVSLPVDTTVMVALEGPPTREIARTLRRTLDFPKERIHALAYWKHR